MLITRISGRYAPFILGLPAGFPRAHAGAHFVRFSCRARRGSLRSLLMPRTQVLALQNSHAAHARSFVTHFPRQALMYLKSVYRRALAGAQFKGIFLFFFIFIVAYFYRLTIN